MSNQTINQLREELSHVQARAAAYDRNQNEGGYGYNPHRARESEIVAQISAVMTAERESWIDAHFDELRAAWNAKIAEYGATMTFQDLLAVEKAVGIEMHEIKAAKARRAEA